MINQELYQLTKELNEMDNDASVLKAKMSVLLERVIKNLNSIKHSAPEHLIPKLEKVAEDVDKLYNLA